MATYVILLRAVNVGGTGKLPMADFKKVLTDLGYRNIATYIQSGNAVVDAKGSAATVARDVAASLENLTGASVGVIVRSHEELDQLVRENPFAAEATDDGSKVHVGFLAAAPGKDARTALDGIITKYPQRRDRYHLSGSTLYLHLPDGAAETKFSGKGLDKAIGVLATGRNWNTVLKLHAMSKR
jgi:uncharacterized protein (DUF1697 family)